MSSPRFSILIPTRNRPHTLQYCLLTCLEQTFDDYEIIVSDNSDNDETKKLIDEFAIPRIRYQRTPHPLAMSANWEFALSEAKGEFVAFVGDDDGLLIDSLKELDGLLKQFPYSVMQWDRANYTWPDTLWLGHENIFSMPTQTQNANELKGVEVIRDIISFKTSYDILPMLYNSIVHRDVIEKCRKKAGRFFAAPAPDVYSGLAIAYAAGVYLHLTKPMSISGVSGKSNGVAQMWTKKGEEIRRDFVTLNEAQGYKVHPKCPNIGCTIAEAVGDSFLWAKEIFFPDNKELEVDRHHLVLHILSQMKNESKEELKHQLDSIRASLVDNKALQKWFEAQIASMQFKPPSVAPQEVPHVLAEETIKYTGTWITANGADFGLATVYDAAQFYTKMLPYVAAIVGTAHLNSEHIVTAILQECFDKLKK